MLDFIAAFRNLFMQNNHMGVKKNREGLKADTMVLCADGWTPVKDVRKGDSVLSLDRDSGEIVEGKVLSAESYEHEWKNSALAVSNANGDKIVTAPFQEFLLYDRATGKFDSVKSMMAIADGINKDNARYMAVKPYHSLGIPRTGIWTGGTEEEFVELSFDKEASSKMKGFHPEMSEKVRIPVDGFMKLLAMCVADGVFPQWGERIRIIDKNKNMMKMSSKLLDELHIMHDFVGKGERTRVNSDHYEIKDIRITDFMRDILSKKENHHIPARFKKMPKEALLCFYNWYVAANDKMYFLKYSEEVKGVDAIAPCERLAYDLNEIQFKIGMCGRVHNGIKPYPYISKLPKMVLEHTWYSELDLCKYFSFGKETKGYHEDYGDPFYAIKTDKGSVYAMLNGYTFWTAC